VAEPAPAPLPAPTRVVGVGASAGGVEALIALASRLPADLDGAVAVVLHVSATGTSVLPQILARNCRLHVLGAEDGLPLLRGHVYVAAADRHMLVEDGHIRVNAGPRENGHRPAIDPLFRSLADAYGAGALGVVLSGMRDDGTAGLARIKAAGGRAVVQDPDEALYPSMPRSAIAHVDVDAVLGIEGVAREVAHFTSREEDDPVLAHDPTGAGADREAPATRYTCPDCGGVLKRRSESGIDRFACSVGHAYSPDSLDEAQNGMVESALWAGARLLEDRATFLGEMADRADDQGHARTSQQFRARASEALERSQVLRGLVEDGR
jgi:two-component system chemotaxis response regulator CheB